MKQNLTLQLLIKEAQEFCRVQSGYKHRDLFGVTDGKAVGTLIEAAFQQ